MRAVPGPQIDLDMIGMRQGRWGICDAEPFAVLEFEFPLGLVGDGRFDERIAYRSVPSLDRAQHLGREPLGMSACRSSPARRPRRTSRITSLEKTEVVASRRTARIAAGT